MSRRVGILVLLVAMFAAMLAASSISSAATPYYVDCTGGNDANNGTSPSTAWKSLAKADSLVLDANKQLRFKMGCTWSGSISLDGTGGFVGAYGSGNMPVIQNNSGTGYVFRLKGSNLTVDNLYAKVTMPAVSSGCQNQPKGDTKAFLFAPSSTRNVVQNSKATGAWAAVYINDTSSFNRVHHNTFQDNNAMLPNDGASSTDDAGAFGVLARGTDNEIDHNTFSGQKACSVDYGTDGSAVEIYNGQRNRTHHNIAIENNMFTEVAGKDRQAQDNTYRYNLVYSRIGNAHGVLVHGNTGAIPTIGTVVANNTFYLTSSTSMGVNCWKCGTTKRLTMKNNIMWVTYRPFIGDAAGVTEDYNMWNKQPGTLTIGAHSKIADPLFMSPSTNNFHLQSTSPAIDAGTYLGGGTALDGNPVPQGIATDMGAYEIR